MHYYGSWRDELFKAVVGHKVLLAADRRDFEFCGIYDGSSQALDLLCACTMSVGFLSCKNDSRIYFGGVEVLKRKPTKAGM